MTNNADDYVKSFYVSIIELEIIGMILEIKKDTFIDNLRNMVNEDLNSHGTSALQEKTERTR